MSQIPHKCRSWKVAGHPLFAWWCRGVCGRFRGKLCEPWCKVVERRGLWTLWLTLGLPVVAVVAIVAIVAILALRLAR